MCYCNSKIIFEYCEYCRVIKSKFEEINKIEEYNENLHFHLIAKVFSPLEQFENVQLEVSELKSKLRKVHLSKKLEFRILYNQIENGEAAITLMRFEDIFDKLTIKTRRKTNSFGKLDRLYSSMNSSQRKIFILSLIKLYL